MIVRKFSGCVIVMNGFMPWHCKIIW
jgi:hypothetical protein